MTATVDAVGPGQARTAGAGAPSRPADLLFVASYVGTAFIRVQAVPALRIAAVDLLLVAAVVVGHRCLRPGNPARDVLRRAMPWAWLYVVANLVALLPIGLPFWAVDQLARDLFVLLVFFSFLAYFVDRPPARRLLWLVLPVMTVIASFMTFAGAGELRAGGSFKNPNYTAHFIIAATICVLAGRYKWWLKAAVVGFAVPGVLATGSFASFVFAGAALLYVVWSWSTRFSPQIRTVTRIVLVCALPILVASGWDRFQEVEDDGAAVGNVDTARFERSSGVRTKIWSDALEVASEHPFGIGNGGFKQRLDVVAVTEGFDRPEVHNDYLAILVESGVVGLVGIGGVVLTIWRAGRPGGPTRVLLFGVLATGLTREVINFRHCWVLLALVLATEWSVLARGGSQGVTTSRAGPSGAHGALAPRHGA